MNTFMCLGTGSGHNGLWNHLRIGSEQIQWINVCV
jgi:hypothetical protein